MPRATRSSQTAILPLHHFNPALPDPPLQLWDGLLTNPNASVTVLAATNRPYELDDAVLRRFNIQVEVGVPVPVPCVL